MDNSILNHHNRESHLRIRDEMSFLERIIESDTVDQGRAISLGIILTQKEKSWLKSKKKSGYILFGTPSVFKMEV